MTSTSKYLRYRTAGRTVLLLCYFSSPNDEQSRTGNPGRGADLLVVFLVNVRLAKSHETRNQVDIRDSVFPGQRIGTPRFGVHPILLLSGQGP